MPTTEQAERTERAQRAVKNFRAMLPGLNSYVRALSGRPSLRIETSAKVNTSTDGNKIYFRPPLALGDNLKHDKSLCDTRDENKRQRCEACAVREHVLVMLYHEMAHIVFDSFAKVSEADKAELTRRAAEERGKKFGSAIAERIERLPERQRGSYQVVAGMISEFLPLILNGIEDARVNAAMFKIRPGLRKMFEANTWETFTNGVDQPDGSVMLWRDYKLNMQVIVGLYVKASGYDYGTFFRDEVIEALDDDEITDICKRVVNARNVSELYNLSFKALARLRELGFCLSDRDPEDEDEREPEPEPESEPEPEPADEPGEEGDEGEGDSDSGEAGDAAGEGAESDASDGSDPEAGDGDASDGDAHAEPEADGAGEAGAPDQSGEPDDADDSAGDAGDAEGEPSSDPEAGMEDDAEGRGSSDGDGSGSTPDGTDEDLTDGEAQGDYDGDESDNEAGGGSGQADPNRESSTGPSEDVGRDDKVGDDGDAASEEPDGESRSDGDRAGDAGKRDAEASAEDDRDESGDGEGADLDSDERGDGLDGGAEGSDGEDSGPGEAESPHADDRRGDQGGQPGGDASPAEEAESDAGDEAVGPDEGDSTGDEPDDLGGEDGAEPIETPEGEGIEVPDYGDAFEIEDAIRAALGHGPGADHEVAVPDEAEESADDRSAVEVAIIQGDYFETPSTRIHGIREHRNMDGSTKPEANVANGWVGRSTNLFTDRELGKSGEFRPSETILGPALLRMRVAFSDNQRGRDVNQLKSGKINARALGKRAWGDDERLFKKRIRPGKRSYFVMIGGDVSLSTAGTNIVLIKKSMLAQAELLDRMGIPFAMACHSGNGTRTESLSVDIYWIKEPDEPWTDVQRQRLEAIGPDAGNIDGHTMEFYRKVLDRVTATDKVLMYYTDGKMPAANAEEELEILQREIKVCRQKQYTLMAVGINTDSPIEHGLDTVQVNGEEDVVKVVQHIEKRLER